jgi:hypothetical protein
MYIQKSKQASNQENLERKVNGGHQGDPGCWAERGETRTEQIPKEKCWVDGSLSGGHSKLYLQAQQSVKSTGSVPFTAWAQGKP